MKKCDIRFKVENDLTTIGAVDESNNIQDITAVTEYKNQFDKEARFFYNYKKEVFAFDGYQLKFNESNLKEFNKIQKNENNYYRTRLGDNLVTVRENLEVFVKQGLNSVENFNFKDKENKLFDKGIPFENISIEQRQALSKQNIIYPANIINKTDLPIEIKNYVNLYNQYISLNSSNRANFATNRSVINENTVLYLDSANKLNYIMAASDLASLEESEVHGNNYLSIALAQRGEQEDVNISESVSDNPVYAKKIKELKIELKELVDKRGRVLPGKERQYNNAKNHLAFLEQPVYDQMKSAIILFLQENKIKVNYSLANSLYEIAIKSDTTADFHEKMQDRFYSDIKLPFAFSYFDSWGMSISELMKKEYNRINTESKKFDGEDGIYIERTHSAKDFNNYIKKNGDRQTKYIWKLIKNVAFKINPEIKFVFEENYRDNIYAKAFTQDQTNFKGTRIEIRASLLQNPKQAAATLVHEIIHSIAHNIIDIVVFNKKKQIHLLTERQINAVKELTKLIKEVQANDKTNKFYGATDEHELLSELTNKEFVEALKEKAPNIFRRIQNFFLNILGIEKNKYRRAEAILKDIISKPVHVAEIGNTIYPGLFPQKTFYKNDFLESVADSNLKLPSVKSGVLELFESNPELANKVYKPLVFGQENNTLESKLKTFFNGFGFQFKEGDSSTDLLNKIIYTSSKDSSVFINNSAKALSQLLLANTNIDFHRLETLIEDTPEFKKLLSDSSQYLKDTHKFLKDGNRIPMEEWVSYIKDYNKIKNEVLEKYLKESLLDNNNSTGLHKLINDFLKWFRDLFTNSKNLKEVTDSLIQQALLNQREVIINSKDLQNKERVTLAKALEETTHGKDIIKTFGEFGLILTGSVSAAEQGSVFRKTGKLLHDIDWVVPKGFTKDFNKKLKDTFPEAVLVREFDSSSYYTQTYMVPPKGYTISNLTFFKPETYGERKYIASYDVLDKNGNIVSNYRRYYDVKKSGKVVENREVYNEGLENVDKNLEAVSVDFFQNKEDLKYDTYTVNVEGINLQLSNWLSSFTEKLKYGRAKDLLDYANFIPNDLVPSTSEITPQQKQEAQQLYSQYLDTKQPDVILPIGTSGSGKSTFIKSLPQENLVVIEPDAMRVEFTGDMNDKSKDKEIYVEAANRAIQAIKQGKQVVFDTTNLTKEKRLPFIEAIKKAIPDANIQYKLMPLNPELAKQRIKAQLARGENRAAVSDETIDRHAASYKQMLEDIKNEPISNFEITPQQKQQAQQLYSQYISQNPNGSVEGFKSWVDGRNNFDKELAQKIQDKLQKLYPEIKLNITNNPIWEQGDNVLNQEEYNNQVNYRLKATEKVLDNLSKIKQWESNKSIDQNTLWKKIGELGISKQQLDLLKESEGSTIEEKLSSFAANYSYTIEINTAKFRTKSNLSFEAVEWDEMGFPTKYKNRVTGEVKNEIEENTFLPTQHYSNLTVPGGTNYTENEIKTPAITPNIKGHAQFSTDNGIGWFRSDEQYITSKDYPLSFRDGNGKWKKENNIWYYLDDDGVIHKREDLDDTDIYAIYDNEYGNRNYLQKGTNSKTRRILEVQSDLFQKGRDSKILSSNPYVTDEQLAELYSRNLSEKDYDIEFNKIADKSSNQFLQLLNKDNNWVTFFVKSIIQDSAKKGYEKVLFPRLDTIIQIESAGKFKTYEKAEKYYKDEKWVERDKNLRKILAAALNRPKEYQNIEHITRLKEQIASHQPALLNTAKFYENDVTNILKKQGYNPVEITDEYGNTWREITINQARDLSEILLQRNEANKIIGQANIKALTVLIDAINQKQDTLPHEYAHHYIAWFRNTPIVQEAIKKWGSEEALVQSIGEQVVKQKGEAYSWWNNFVKWIMNQFNSLSKLQKEELTQILTDAFLTRQDLNNIGNNSFQQFQQSLNNPDTNPILQGNRTIDESEITYTDEEGNPCAKMGGRTSTFTKGSKWEIVKDLKGYPSHAQGGVDIKLGKDGFSFTRNGGEIKAAHGLVLPKIK